MKTKSNGPIASFLISREFVRLMIRFNVAMISAQTLLHLTF